MMNLINLDKLSFWKNLQKSDKLTLAMAIELLFGLFFFSLAHFGIFYFLFSFIAELRPLFDHLSIAFFVAFILTLTVERLAKKELKQIIDNYLILLKKESTDALNAVITAQFTNKLKELIPEPVYEQVYQNIVLDPFYRVNFNVKLTIKIDENNPQHVYVTSHDEYIVKNISDLPNKFIATGELEKRNVIPDACKFVWIEKVTSNSRKRYENQELEKILKHYGENIEYELEQDLRSKETIEIKTKRIRIQLIQDRFNWITTQMCKEMNVWVTHPENLFVLASVLNPSKNKLELVLDDLTEKHWRFKEGLLPYQGFEIQWYPKD